MSILAGHLSAGSTGLDLLHVEPARELRRELRVEKIHHQRIALPAALTVSGKSNAMRLIG